MFQSSLLAVILFVTSPLSIAQERISAPTTQPAAAQVAAKDSHQVETLAQVFAKTRVGQLVEGKKQVSLDEVRNPAFWLDTVRDLLVTALGFIPRLIVAGLFIAFFWLIYRTVRRLVLASLNAAHVDPSIRDMLGHLLKWSIMGFGFVIAGNQIGIQIAALLTGVSIIGLAVGFAAQETLANFIAGIVIFWDKPFKVGDWVELEETFGQVQRVTFRSTRILDNAGQIIVFPNTHMLSTRVSNHSSYPLTRVRVDIGIAYGESIDDARQVLLSIVQGDDRICQEPAPSVAVAECASSSVNLALYFWVEDESIERAMKGEYLEKAKKAFDQAGIQIPFPHMQLLLEDSPALQALLPAPEPEVQPLRKAG
jgi:small conductance mechanosensitive channel